MLLWAIYGLVAVGGWLCRFQKYYRLEPSILLLLFLQVMVDRGGEYSAMFDGTYRLLCVDGKDWPMINGGPSSNYYSEPGDKSEYATTIINCLFQFCKRECQPAYKSYFVTMKNLPVVMLGMGPFEPAVVGSDRAPAISNAAVEVWPNTRCVLCWPHVYLYIKQGKFGKYMSPQCTPELRARIEADITSLHQARNQDMFDCLFTVMADVWADEGEGDFAAYFERHYASGIWSRWFYRASNMPGANANQNPVEARHNRQKKVIGKKNLNASALVVANRSAPLIVASEGISNAELHKWPSTAQVIPRLSATVAAKARNLANFRSIKVIYFALCRSSTHPSKTPFFQSIKIVTSLKIVPGTC